MNVVTRTALRLGAQALELGAALLDQAGDRLRQAAEGEEPAAPAPRVDEGIASPATPGPRPARVSKPKNARAVRRRTGSNTVTELEVPGATGRGGTPGSVEAENTPKARAAAKRGREPAPMGSHDDSAS